jgi:hypothetical protein
MYNQFTLANFDIFLYRLRGSVTNNEQINITNFLLQNIDVLCRIRVNIFVIVSPMIIL